MDRLRDIKKGGDGGNRSSARTSRDEDEEATPHRRDQEMEMDERPKAKSGAAAGEQKSKGGGLSSTISEHMRLYDDIKDGLIKIREATRQIERLKEKEQKAINDAERKANMAELDKIMSDTGKVTGMMKKKLDEIKAENDKYAAVKENMHSATTQMRANMYQTNIRRFHHEMNAYNQAAADFKAALKERTRRQLPILIKGIDPETVEKIVEEGHADEVISQALISEDLDNVVAEIEARHKGIMKLEQQVLEIYQLFKDLAVLVDLQQETMDVISERIERAKDFTGVAEEELRKAKEQQRKARNRQCCIFIIVLCILVAILAPILITQLGNL